MKNLLKKTLCLVLTLGMLASMMSIGALASNNPDIVIYEDFETDSTIGNDIIGWNNWVNKQTSAANDSYFKIQQESTTNTNKVGHLTRTNSNDASKQFLPTKNSDGTVKTGDYANMKVRLLTTKTSTTSFTVSAYPEGSTSRVILFTVYFNATPELASSAGKVYACSTNKSISNSALEVNKWYDFDLYFDFKNSQMTMFVDDVKLFDKGTLSLSSIESLRFESARNTGAIVPEGHDGTSVVADFMIDDILVENITAQEYENVFKEPVAETDIVLSEDFETDSTIGNDIIGWNNWVNKHTSAPNDSYFKIQRESETNTNKVGHLTRTNSNDTSIQFYPTKNSDGTVKTGDYANMKVRLLTTKTSTTSFTVSAYPEGSTSRVSLFTVYFNATPALASNIGKVYAGSTSKAISNTALEINNWYDFDLYFDFKNSQMTMFVDDVKLFDKATLSLSSIAALRFESARNTGAIVPEGHDGTSVVADFMIDDILVENITAQEYENVFKEPVVETDIIFSEDFETGIVGNDIIGWNNWVNKQTSAANDSNFKIQQESTSNTNKVGHLTRTNSNDASKQFLPTRNGDTGQKTGDYASFKFRVLTTKENTTSLGISAYQNDSTRVHLLSIYFNAHEELAMNIGRVFVSAGEKAITPGTPMETNKWYDFEMYLDFKNSKMTMYVNDVKLFDEVALTLSDITAVRFESTRNAGAIVPENHDGTSVVADFMLDDIVLENVTAEEYADATGREISVAGVNYDGNKLSSVKVNVEYLPTVDDKMFAAVYSVNGDIATLKAVSECSVTSISQPSAALQTPIDVASGDIVKVFFWDMSKLLPQNYFETIK